MSAENDCWLDRGQLRNGVIVVALGGNLGGGAAVKKRCTDVIEKCSKLWGEARCSNEYMTQPIGEVLDQPDFLNLVAAWHFEGVSPEEALVILQELEQFHHRERLEIGGPRTLDLDLLLLGSEHRDTKRLTLPHARMAERRFVLQPLVELFGPRLRWRGPEDDLGALLETQSISCQSIRRWDAQASSESFE